MFVSKIFGTKLNIQVCHSVSPSKRNNLDGEAGSPIQDNPATCPVLSVWKTDNRKNRNVLIFVLLVNVRSCNEDINYSIYNVNIKCVCQEYEDMSHIYVRHIFIFLCINVYIYKCRELDRHGKNCSSS